MLSSKSYTTHWVFLILIASANIELNPGPDNIYDQDFKLLSKFKGIKIINLSTFYNEQNKSDLM